MDKTGPEEEAVVMEKQVAAVLLLATAEDEGVRGMAKKEMLYRKKAAEEEGQ